MQVSENSKPQVQEQLNVVWYYILARLLLGFGVLIWVVFSVRFDMDFQLPANLSFYTLGGVFALMGTMAFFSTQHGEKPWFVWLQFVVDALFISMLLCSGSSHHNPFVLLFALNILAAMSLGWARDVLLVTLLDITCYALVQYAGSRGMLSWIPTADSMAIYVKVISEIFGLALIGGLGMVLAQQQALTSETLRRQILTTRRLRRRHIDVLNELPIALFIQIEDENAGGLIPQNQIAEAWMKQASFIETLQSASGHRFVFADQVFQMQEVSLSTEERLLLIEDVTRVLELEKTIAQEEQLAIVGRLSASLAHEIRNPIASLSGAVQLLAEQQESRLHTIILREVRRINELVDLFLQSARSQQLSLELQRIDASIQEIVEALKHDPRAQRTSIDVAFESSVAIQVDVAKFRQIVWNVLLNSIQAGQAKQISILVQRTEEDLVVSINDDGTGIPSEHLSKVLDPFFTTRAGGTGLGLFVVQQIMSAHQGNIKIDSEAGKGTQVALHFPLQHDTGDQS